MSRHWKPDEGAVTPLRSGKRLKSLDEFTPPDFVGDFSRQMKRVERQLPNGAKAGLVLVAAACVGIAIGLYQALGPLEVFAPGAELRWSEADEPQRR